jgi:hypothetical protein
MINPQYPVDIIMSGNGYKQVTIPTGMNYVSVINNTDNTIELYQDYVTKSGDGKLLLKIPMFTALTIPVNKGTAFSFVWINGGSNDTKTVHVIFSTQSLSINTTLGSNASLGNVTITGDNVGLIKASQLPSTLDSGGNLKVAFGGSAGINHGLVHVDIAGTQTQLPSRICKEVLIVAKKSNNGSIFLGGAGVSSVNYGIELKSGDSVSLSVNNTNLIYINASVSGEGISYVAI